jgi:hypothetical protein
VVKGAQHPPWTCVNNCTDIKNKETAIRESNVKVDISEIGHTDPGDIFALEEATAMLNCHVVPKDLVDQQPNIDVIGFVAGVITLNDEVEILLKFQDSLQQVGKFEFIRRYLVVPIDG